MCGRCMCATRGITCSNLPEDYAHSMSDAKGCPLTPFASSLRAVESGGFASRAQSAAARNEAGGSGKGGKK
jgi:hypothetical protein